MALNIFIVLDESLLEDELRAEGGKRLPHPLLGNPGALFPGNTNETQVLAARETPQYVGHDV